MYQEGKTRQAKTLAWMRIREERELAWVQEHVHSIGFKELTKIETPIRKLLKTLGKNSCKGKFDECPDLIQGHEVNEM